MDYLSYWGMHSPPFENAPNPRFFYESRGHLEAITRLLLAVQSRKPLALLTGDYGCGKTILCQTVMDRLSHNEYVIGQVTNPRMEAVDLIREIAYQLGEDVHSHSKYDVVHAFNSLLDRYAGAGKHCAVFVDEAQLISDFMVLEDLRLLLNYQRKGQYLLTIILVGQTELRDRLRPIPQLMQRIALRFHVPTLEPDEVGSYIRFRIETAGGKGDIFSADAIQEIASASRGNPREVNADCDLSLLVAALSGKAQVGVEEAREAIRERI